MEDMSDKCSVLKGALLEKTFAKTTVAPVQKNLSSVAALVDTGHEVEINRTCGIQRQDCGNTSAESVARADGLRTGAVCDGAKTLAMTSMLLKSVSETQWHGNRTLEVKRFLKLTMSWHASQGTSAAREQADWTDTNGR